MPGSLGYTYLPGQWVRQLRGSGDHATYQTVLEWCPTVTAHLGGYSPRGDLTKRMVTIQVGQESATARISEVEDGTVWERFSNAVGTHKRDVREALANLVDDQASRLDLAPLHSRWVKGRLMLPPPAALPRGYGAVSGTEDEWRELLAEIALSPRMVLTVGLAIAGLYVLPLGRQSYTVHLPGASSEGKTTTETAAAAFFGNPRHVIQPWSVTKQGPGSWLRSMVMLTGFRDELGASSMNASQLETLIFGLMQGAERDMSSKTGDYRESQGSWHGALISSGNESMVGQIANEGIAARVVEITGPFTLNAAHADRITEMCSAVHGHGLVALADRGPTPVAFSKLAGSALSSISTAGGVPGRLAQHLAFGVAGAHVLARLAGCPEFSKPALAAARGVLDELVAGLAERGARPGDRLLEALRGSLASEPGAWPTREFYVKQLQGLGLQKDALGWDLVGDDDPGDLAVIPAKLKGIAEAAGINDSGIALRDLRKRNLLIPDNDKKHLARQVRVGSRLWRAYVIKDVLLTDDQPQIPEQRTSAEPCTTCQLPGPMCAPGTVADVELPCVCCGVPTPVRSACGAPRTGICQGLGFELPPEDPAPAPSPIRRGAHPAAVARTEARAATEAASIATLEDGGALRMLEALATTHAPLRRDEKGRMCQPRWRPADQPGITFAAHIITGWAWSRRFSGQVVALDRSGAWVAAASSVEVGFNALAKTGEIEFEGAPGYYHIMRHPWTETRLPDPLKGAKGDTVWVPGPTVALLAGLVTEDRWPDVSVLDSYTSVGVRINKWTDYVNKMRSTAIKKYGRDSEEYGKVKDNFGTATSLMLGRSTIPKSWGCSIHRPDWTHSIQAQASANLWRWADDCLKLGESCAPVALRNVDELVIPAEGLEIVKAGRTGGRSGMMIDPDGIKLGSFKVKAVENV